MFSQGDFRKELVRAMKSQATASHPVFQELLQPRRNDELLRLMALQTYQLTKMFERYVAGLFYHCPIFSFRRRLASNLYEEVTGELSKTDGHLELMQKFLRSLDISDDAARAAQPLPDTLKLIEYRRQLIEDPARYHMGAAAVMIASEGQTIQKEGGRHPYMALAELYGLSESDVQFFAVHAEEDVHHVAEGLDYACELCTTEAMQGEAIEAVRQTVILLWAHYDGILREYQARQGKARPATA
jgi:pyrroloquinoline-quinone synthase